MIIIPLLNIDSLNMHHLLNYKLSKIKQQLGLICFYFFSFNKFKLIKFI